VAAAMTKKDRWEYKEGKRRYTAKIAESRSCEEPMMGDNGLQSLEKFQ
jgi:hypothetical protein